MTPYSHRDLNVTRLLADKAERNGGKPFLYFEDRIYSYEDVHRLSNRLANALAALGVQRSTHVAMLMENKPEIVLLYFALGKLGAIAVPINTAAKGEMLAYFLTQSDAEIIIFDAALGDRVRDAIEQSPTVKSAIVVDGEPPSAWPEGVPVRPYARLLEGDPSAPDATPHCADPFMLMYTSGTTGRSKGVMVPQASVLAQAMGIADACDFQPDDVLYTCLPLFHANAWWCSCLPALFADAAVAVSRRFSAGQFWAEVKRYRATQFNLLGAMANFLWNRPASAQDRDHRVRQAIVVPVPVEFYHAFEARFGLTLKSLYGLTDACISAIKRPDDPPEKWRSAGRACDYVELRIVDEDDFELPPGTVGNLVIRGREPWALAQGYYKMPEATAAAWRNLWLHTDDRAAIDGDGFLYFVDRKKDAIRRRGENISSFEIEQIVLKHPAVAEVAAFAVTSEHGEDEVMVTIVRRPDAALSAPALIDHCDRNMPYFMVPRFVDFVAALPRNMTEKIEKYKLRADAERRRAEIWDRERAGIVIRR